MIGLSSIYCFCICVLWNFKVVLRHSSLCSYIFHHCCALLLVSCLIECPSDILELNWIQVNSNFWVYTCLTLFNLFWSLIMCFTHFAHVAHTRHTPKHPFSTPMHLMLQSHASPCITCCTHMHPHLLNTNTHMHMYLFYALWLCLLGLMPLACCLSLFTLFFELVLLCFRLFYLYFELTCI